MIFRKATLEEIPLLVELRKIQLVDEGIAPDIDIDAELTDFFEQKMGDGSLVEWVATDNGEIVATAAVAFYQFPPSYTNKTGWKAYVTNMYTRNDYRRRGVATSLLNKLVEEAKAAGVTRLWLGASVMGKPVYKKFGFVEADNWLELRL